MQQRDQYTQIEDFLADESFRQWVKHGHSHEYWATWTVENTQRAKLVAEARLWILALRVTETTLPPADTQHALHTTWEKIKQAEQNRDSVPSVWQWSRWYKAAAVVAFGLLLGWIFKYYTARSPVLSYIQLVKQDGDGLIEQANNTDKPQLITLSDGSSVLLLPQSKLSYPKSFRGAERRVYLLGEGFFEISKNPHKPFLVFAHEVVTKVVGTSFWVKAYAEQSDVEVIVKTGKVDVRPNTQVSESTQRGVLLLPNQGVRFRRQELAFENINDLTQNKQTELRNSIGQLSFDFTDVPVTQIFRTIEQAYLVEIEFPKEVLKDCYLTTSLSDQPLPEKLKIICESLGNNTRYEMNGNHIVIISNGCN